METVLVSLLAPGVTFLTFVFHPSHNGTVPPYMIPGVTCTSLSLTALQLNHRLKMFIRGAKFWLDLLRSRKNVLKASESRRGGFCRYGFRFSVLVCSAPQWLADFAHSFFALRTRSSRFTVDFPHAVSLVLLGRVSRPAGCPHVFRDRRLSSLLFSSLVQNQPRLSIRDGFHG